MTTNGSPDFTTLKLRPFISPGFGLVFHAPETWHDAGDQDLFQVVDPATDAQFTASAYQNPGVSLRQWVDARLAIVAQQMPFLSPVAAAYDLRGASWSSMASEYRGCFPNNDFESHYLVLCLPTEQRVISFTITASTQVFAENRALYLWLLQNKLELPNLLPV